MRRLARLGLSLIALSIVAPGITRAQESIQLEQYRPAPTVDDGFVISRPDDRGHLLFGARLDLSYALNPLVVERVAGDASTEATALVEHMLVGHLNFSLGLFDRLVIYAGLPVTLVQSGDSFATVRGGDDAGLGDVFVGARVRIYGDEDDPFAMGAQLTVTLPTAGAANSGTPYSGEAGATFHPNLLFEVRPLDALRLTANLGARFRTDAPARVVNLSVSHELTWGIGGTITAVEDLLDLYLEGWGAATFENIGGDGSRESTHLEILGGARFEVVRGFQVGAAVGTGLARGYGSPDFRGVLTLGYAEQRPVPIPPPGDRDGDGMTDDVDSCPDEPEDFDRFEDEDGCPDPDNDADGVLDSDDDCPLEPEDIDEFEDENGCPDPDNDSDGVLDAPDGCPNAAEDVDQFEDEDGCPDLDNDADTVLDVDDNCPVLAGTPANEGCPEAQIEEGQISILNRVEFETDSDVLLDLSTPILEAVASLLDQHPELILLRVEGHTDDRGGLRHNRDLSARRARSVARWLVARDINPDRLRAFGCGEEHPLESNGSDEGRQTNRRVEFHILIPEPETGPRSLEGCRELSL